MKTYFLGAEEVRSYLRDCLDRLETFEVAPAVLCPVTVSGWEIFRQLVEVITQDARNLAIPSPEILRIHANDDRKITFDHPNPGSVIAGRSVLLIDGAIHSGRMMSDCVEQVATFGPSEVSAYSLVVKRGSTFIPTLWGLMIDETDRAYFMLERIPNNRLKAGQRPQPPILLRLLTERDFTRPPVVSGVKSLDRITWSDRFFQMKVTSFETCTYVLERNSKAVGYLTVQPHDPKTLLISEVVVDQGLHRTGYGGVLMRFADTLARQNDCRSVRLYAIKNKIEFYENFGYSRLPTSPIPLDDEEYHLMEHPILYHEGPWR